MFFKLILENANGDRVDKTTAGQSTRRIIRLSRCHARLQSKLRSFAKRNIRLEIYRMTRNALNV